MDIFKSKGLQHWFIYLTMAIFFAVVQIQLVDAATLNSCTYPGAGGDYIDRAFYVPNYTGVNLQQVTLQISTSTTGSHTFSLTAHSGTFDGPVIGTASSTVNLTAGTGSFAPVVFDFGTAPVSLGSTVAFVITRTAGPAGFQYFRTFGSFSGDPTCPVVETEDATPPLSTFRRQGIDVVITGDLQTAASVASVPTMNEWGMIIFIALAGLGSAYYLRRKK